MDNVSEYYNQVRQIDDALVESKRKDERPFDPDENSVWLVSQYTHDQGGKPGVAVMVVVHDRAGTKRAAQALALPGHTWRLATLADTLPGGPIFENLKLQEANLAARRLADAKADKNRPFMVQIPGAE